LVGQCDETNLRKTQRKLTFQQRVDRQQQRLHQVVEKMRNADRTEDIEMDTQAGWVLLNRRGSGLHSDLRQSTAAQIRFAFY